MASCEHGRPLAEKRDYYINDSGHAFPVCRCCNALLFDQKISETPGGLLRLEEDHYCPMCNPAGAPPLGVFVTDVQKTEEAL